MNNFAKFFLAAFLIVSVPEFVAGQTVQLPANTTTSTSFTSSTSTNNGNGWGKGGKKKAPVDPDGTWIFNGSGNWSDTSKWTSSPPGGVADGAGATADFSTLDITSSVTVTIDTTSRTLGILKVGDTNGSNSYTLTNSGGATLTFDNGGSNARLNETSTSAGDLIDESIRLKGSLDITNASANTLTFTGSIQSSATSGTQTISFLSGNESVSAVISNGGTGGTIAVSKSGTGTLTLSGSNTYTGGTTVSAGTLALGPSGTPVGTGTLTLSDGATLRSSAGGPSGARTLQNAISLSGNITLGNAVNDGTLTFDGTSLAHGVTLTGNTRSPPRAPSRSPT